MSKSDLPSAKFLRLQNGDDLISEVVELGDDDNVYYLLINPLKVVYMESENIGYVQIAFMPWVFPKICDVQEFTLHLDDILFITEISSKMNEHYWENVESFIAYKETGKLPSKEEPETHDEEIIKEILDGLASKRTFH